MKSHCKHQTCDRKHYSRGWCSMHYNRWRKHGDPSAVLPVFNRKQQSEETRKKISNSMKGVKKSLEMRAKLSMRKKGPNSLHLWKGGITEQNRIIRQSFEYRLWRTQVYERDNYTCQVCLVRGGKLNADHIKPFCDYVELRFDLDNGRTLCEGCHRNTPTFGGRANKKKDRKMEVIIWREALKELERTNGS